MRTSLRGLLAATLLCLAAGAAPAAPATEPPHFAFTVICDDPVLAKTLRTGIEQRLAKAHADIRDKFPSAKLFVYANRDANDRKNPDGVSIAVAHVTNMPTTVLALSYVQKKEAMPDVLRSMLAEEGFLKHLNVAHMDAPTETQVNTLLDNVVATFLKKSSGEE